MKLLKNQIIANGNLKVTVAISRKETLLSITEGAYYQLPSGVIVPAADIIHATPVYWSKDQNWVAAGLSQKFQPV